MGRGLDYFDISPAISEKTAVFPGDTPFRRKIELDFKTGHHLQLSSVSSSLHIGAHVDAPNHYHAKGESIDQRDLGIYIGRCQVISVKIARGERIYPKDISATPIQAERVLFKTGSFPDPENWNSDFNSLSPELVSELAAKKVILVGIDTPSVDPEQSKQLEAHTEIFKHGMANLEGIVLSQVPDGLYTLIATPLRLKDADASPVRAILLKGDPWKA
jgi:arylformamidase